MTSKKIILVALSGCSSSGKTTIAKLTANLFKEATLIHEDDFYKHDKDVPVDTKYNIQNWDSPEALDFKLFGAELDLIKQTGKIATKLIHNDNVDDPFTKFCIDKQVWNELGAMYDSIDHDKYQVVIVDGFMIFNNTEISRKFDLKILVRAPYEVLKKRRSSRKGYQTLDSFWVDPPYYFDEFVYKSYRESHAQLFVNGDVEGNLDPVKAKHIKEFINNDNTPIESPLKSVCYEILKLCKD
ncbi:ribosylnicotinamide kinase [Saccharomyces pastorianus]|uniref:Ribosylnicotinamide kinase n=1 Tax=Saccharomyces pastorianus TaxID=27292 RepID=A0A6C1EEW4_SACPS|nr:NRK1-like protein [Saccharomyces eubayanus]KOG97034.1 NRK1-like protein [Saccharomyces eubayanus]QID87655.1 ribosylnicotinamide kinase [Saccharomyces pastorianus]